VRRIGQAEKVEVGVALALVELVVAPLVVLMDKAKVGELARNGVPLALRQRQQVVTAAQEVEQRPVIEALVEVIGAVTALPAIRGCLPPDERAIVARVSFEEREDHLVHGREQRALQHCPCRWRQARHRCLDGDHSSWLLSRSSSSQTSSGRDGGNMEASSPSRMRWPPT